MELARDNIFLNWTMIHVAITNWKNFDTYVALTT